MNLNFFKLLAVAIFLTAFSNYNTNASNIEFDNEHRLWYDRPAILWEETLPLGNGRLGMMTDGGITSESIVLNESSMWSGCEWDYSNPDAAKSLPVIRELLQQGRNDEAQDVMYRRFVPSKPTDGGTYGSYQILSRLVISHKDIATEGVSGYRRELDLKTAKASTSFRCPDTRHDGTDSIEFHRMYYVSRHKDVMIIEMDCSKKRSISFDIGFKRKERGNVSITSDGWLKLEGELDSGSREVEGVRFCAFAKIACKGGEIAINQEQKTIGTRNADKAYIIISAATTFFEGNEYQTIAASKLSAATCGYGSLNARMKRLHRESTTAHQNLYNRAEISIYSNSDASELPTDQRLHRYASGSDDHSLAALYYNYGRYLLISSTRPGCLPPNLQGLWANTIQTPWNGDYHTNINVQMNHWIAEQGNLSELHLPLTELILKLVPSGEKTAKDFYGPTAQGWVQHMMTNVWNYTAPGEHPSWGATNTGGAWLCSHLWEHYSYTGDKIYLERVFPTLQGAARFFLSTMITDRKYGYLVTGPTSSPENAFYMPDSRKQVSICLGPTMDNQIVRELFTNTVSAAEILGKETPFTDSLRLALDRIAPEKISPQGYLMEWLEDYEETDIHHRHVSHLYDLYPGKRITPGATPKLAEACRVTLNRRGDEATGWSRAWKLNFWARLADGDRALKLLKSLLSPAVAPGTTNIWKSGTYPNLFCSHPPFQIDGNFGGAAGIGEMLLQSHEGFVNILPALPSDWKGGYVKGFKVRGGAEIDLHWENGTITEISVRQEKHSVTRIWTGNRFLEIKGSGKLKQPHYFLGEQ